MKTKLEILKHKIENEFFKSAMLKLRTNPKMTISDLKSLFDNYIESLDEEKILELHDIIKSRKFGLGITISDDAKSLSLYMHKPQQAEQRISSERGACSALGRPVVGAPIKGNESVLQAGK